MAAVTLARSTSRVSSKILGGTSRGFSALVEDFPLFESAHDSYSPGPVGVTQTTLPNGVKVVSVANGKPAAFLGVTVDAGSRNESASEAGNALLLKHMAFKATNTRSDLRLARDIEAAGLTATAEAGRESISYGLSGTADGLEVAMTALGETVTAPKMQGWEVDEIKASLVMKELNFASVDPQIILMETLHEAAYGSDSPMGLPFMATPKSVTADSLKSFMGAHYVAPKMTVVGSGISHESLEGMAGCYFGSLPSAELPLTPPSPFLGGYARVKAEASMTHLALAFGVSDAAAALVLKHFLQTAVPDAMAGSFALTYSDSVLVGLCGAAEPSAAGHMVNKFTAAVNSSANVSEDGLAMAKVAAKTAVLLGLEEATPSSIASLASIDVAAIDAVSSASLKALVSEMVKAPALASVGPSATVPSYTAVSGMF
mmetsp:Transcript_11323/g.14971  ORF Transcript_11323/g.14971 Transcript_11323/m.14971 type:complete len:430 (-) Transcript_11323:349-1638(-)|eukprot:CAMPEP_0185770640 /NCGR_PEP_ID=MMETSP1174-20130828/60282_1 /TAXON_ID=35687 /ORGANISM="Dictyocha speculum, Strain CCMP1381" /LENGTH=429 /DNA_ID=CAMNT_0028456167 /DNA_START=46 /DNA_END=1335 /DNA_ORIENTATION=-